MQHTSGSKAWAQSRGGMLHTDMSLPFLFFFYYSTRAGARLCLYCGGSDRREEWSETVFLVKLTPPRP
jgi:hypothetical protein